MRKHARDLLEGLRGALAHAQGRPLPGTRVHTVHVPDVKAIRLQLKMSQSAFAKTFRIPVGTLQNWEQGLRRPDATAAAYLTVIARHPKTVRETVDK